MRKKARWLFAGACIATLLVQGLPASGQVVGSDSGQSDNLTVVSRTAATNTATNSDLAFFTDGGTEYTVAGNFAGFRIINTTDAANPVVVSNFACNGPQNDVSVAEAADGSWYLFQSIDTPQTLETCNSNNTDYTATPNAFEGIRIFDISDPAAPVFVDAVATDCGSHTHTVAPGSHTSLVGDENLVYLYISSYPLSGQQQPGINPNGTECTAPHKKISIVTVDLANPTAATVVEDGQDLFTKTFDFGTVTFAACHDIAVALGVNANFANPGDWAAGACFEEGQLWDISDPTNPQFVNRWRNDNNTTVDLYHSAGFTWDGKLLIFGDEAGGGGGNRCRFTKDQQGRFWFHEFDSMKVVGSYKIPRPQSQNCTGHIYNAIPTTNNRYLLASSWYSGGTSVVDFTNPTEPKEVAFYDAADGGPGNPRANTWATYWYNGLFYANDIGRGVEIYDVEYGPLNQAIDFPDGAFNPQTQLDMFDDSKGCTVFGTAHADVLKGTNRRDVICGFGGRDEIYGFNGVDRILGGEGHDEVYAGSGADIVGGGSGNDALFGQGGRDQLTGGPGNDRLVGGPGRDACRGGTGSDRLRSC